MLSALTYDLPEKGITDEQKSSIKASDFRRSDCCCSRSWRGSLLDVS